MWYKICHFIYMLNILLYRYCGESAEFKNLPQGPIEYPGNALLIKLKSDDGYQFKGFKARYTIDNWKDKTSKHQITIKQTV